MDFLIEYEIYTEQQMRKHLNAEIHEKGIIKDIPVINEFSSNSLLDLAIIFFKDKYQLLDIYVDFSMYQLSAYSNTLDTLIYIVPVNIISIDFNKIKKEYKYYPCITYKEYLNQILLSEPKGEGNEK